MKIWTVVSQDDTDKSSDHLVAGSYTSRRRALDGCADYIFGRIELRDDLAYGMAHDENHPEAAKFFSERRTDGGTEVRTGCAKKLRDYVRDMLDRDGTYYVYDGCRDSWHFDVDENDLCGDAWSLVTWGDCDHEDPEFTTPFPELFTDGDKAVADAVGYAKDLMDSHGYEAPERDSVAGSVGESLKADGQARLDLDDGTAVHWVLYHFGMETENTDVRA